MVELFRCRTVLRAAAADAAAADVDDDDDDDDEGEILTFCGAAVLLRALARICWFTCLLLVSISLV